MGDGSLTRLGIIEGGDSEALKNFLVMHGQGLLPMVELIEQPQVVAAEMIEVLGRATIEAVLRVSAEQIAWPPQPFKKGNAMGGK